MLVEGADKKNFAKNVAGGSNFDPPATFPYEPWLLLLIFAAMEGGAVVAIGAVGGLGRVGVGAGAAERGLLGVLGVGEAALVLDAGQAGLHVVEFRGGDGVFVAWRQNAGNLLLRVEDAVRGLRMVREGLGDQAGFPLLERLDLLKEGDEGLRIVAGLVHVLEAEVVSLRLKVAGELEEGHGDGELHRLVDAVAGPAVAGHHDERNGAELGVVHARHLAGGVVGADVGYFMRHHASHLGFLVGIQDEAGVHVEEPAGQRHGVDFVGIDDLDGERNLAIGVLDDVLADAVDVLGYHGVGDEFGALFDLRGVGFAHLDFAVGRVPVAHAAAADFAIADGVHVLDAAGLDVDLLAARLDHLFRVDGAGGYVALDGFGADGWVLLALVLLVPIFIFFVGGGGLVAVYGCGTGGLLGVGRLGRGRIRRGSGGRGRLVRRLGRLGIGRGEGVGGG